MRIVVRSSQAQKEEWLSKPASTGIDLYFIDDNPLTNMPVADAWFDLLFTENKQQLPNNDKPVFVNAVVESLCELPGNCIRINAWNGFLRREIVELVTSEENKPAANSIMNQLGWKYIFVPDIPGMIAARSISMIINEAYYALGDKVSSKHDIDTAMKLGTNYPYGPFEWSEKIGLTNVYKLLKTLADNDSRYSIAPALEHAVQTQSVEK